MYRRNERNKPGAHFAFKPSNNLTSGEQPGFSEPANKKCIPTHANNIHSPSHGSSTIESRDSAIMVKERAPPKAPPLPKSTEDAALQREKSPDSDTDISALISGWSALKPGVREGTGAFTSKHPTKMMSSRKQKADIFIHQKTRPEHHLDTRISGPREPAYQDKRAPSLPMFNSNPSRAAPPRYGEEVFYTDPAKASEDLKALLEGGMEGEEEDGVEELDEDQQSQENPETTTKTEAPTNTKGSKLIQKDGEVEGLQVRLLPHQVEGVNWMRGRELGPVKRGKVPKGGLLADDMGLGKTLQTISLIITNQKPQKDDKNWKKSFEGTERTTLVVAPLALIRQWEHEIKEKVLDTHGLDVLVHHGPQRTKNPKDLAPYDVVITTYQILVSEHGNSSDDDKGTKVGCFGLHWWRVVLDEAHTIKNRLAKSTKACCALRSEYRWCLSGTPMQNNLDELQSLIKFLRIRPYDDIKEWKEQIDKPMKGGKGHIAIRRLHSLLRCFMKRRTKEILKEDGALNPGGKPTAEGEVSTTGFRHTNRKVVTVAAELNPAERRFYQSLEARADKSMTHMMQNKMNYANAFTLLLRLRQACNHPKLVEGKLEKDKDALSTDASQKSQDTDVDAMADMFSGMGITTKSCSVCGRPVTKEGSELGRDHCAECHEDLASFSKHDKSKKDKKKSSGKKKKSKTKRHKEKKRGEEEKTQPVIRRPRNRNAIIDSDDEEEEEATGTWLVPENERGNLDLGKAGGEEDENAEGGGDWIGSDDSEEEEEGNDEGKSNLSSFVVDDETAKKEAGYKSAEDASDDDSDDSLLSISAITKKMASQTLEDKNDDEDGEDGNDTERSVLSQGSASDVNSDASSGSDGSDSDSSSSSDSGVDESELYSTDDDGRPEPGSAQVLASAKIRELTKILQAEAHEHKFIVFSQFTSMLDLVEPFLRKGGFHFTRYDGSMKNDEREESLRGLREDKKVRVLLCSLKCGSLGLNLTAATRVVIIEPFWNPVSAYARPLNHRL